MNALPEAAAFARFLARAQRRAHWLAAGHGATIGIALAAVAAVIGWILAWPPTQCIVAGACLAAAGSAIPSLYHHRRRELTQTAIRVEQRAPSANLLVTAAELLETTPHDEPRSSAVAGYMRDAVIAQAARVADTLDVAQLMPARTTLLRFTAAVLLWVLAVGATALRPVATTSSLRTLVPAAAGRINALRVAVTPPAYTRSRPATTSDPQHVEAFAGSTIRISLSTGADQVFVETLAGRREITSQHEDNDYTAELVAERTGFIAVESREDGAVSDRKLISLTVVPDAAPRARIATPGKDIFTADSTRSVDIMIEADDDVGLASLALRYTKVSGSGEKFSFTDGTLPLQVMRTDARTWRARATLGLASLAMTPGDMLVYRAIVRDARPGSPAVESDALIVEITAPGSVAAAGFAADDETDKHALSQEMLILKTQRLIARASSLPPDSLTAEAMLLAAEQRAIRADFVFMMGGELAEEVIEAADANQLNEEAEAAGEEDLAAGRAVNRGRIALVQAIRSMSQASTALTGVDLQKALTHEKAGLASLQDAFSRTRYILRALTQRERLDMSRRLTGDLSAASSTTYPAAAGVGDSTSVALRRALYEIALLGGVQAGKGVAAAKAAALSSSVMRIDPTSSSLRDAATQLNTAAAAFNDNNVARARAQLDVANATLYKMLLGRTPPGAGNSEMTLELKRLRGALNDALRRGIR